jgi:tetratricopeptide (TPR) repeat protein
MVEARTATATADRGDRWNVLLSYTSVNRTWALSLYDYLRHVGYKVFVDQGTLKTGDELTPRVDEALRASQSAVLIWSRADSDSTWIRREHHVLEREAAVKRGFRFVAVLLDDSKPPSFAANLDFPDFSSFPEGPNGGAFLRLLYALVGEPLSREAARFALDWDDAAERETARVRAAIRNGNPERLLQMVEEGGSVWASLPALPCKAAEGLIKLGRPTEAISLLERIIHTFPKALRPKQLLALALVRRGGNDDLADAQRVLGELYALGEMDPETLALYAKTWSDRYTKSGDPTDLKRARDFYVEAFEKAPDDYYSGLNAAAMSVNLGSADDLEKASAYAERVIRILGTEVALGDYWKTATIAEVLLLQRKYREAARLYQAAVNMTPSEKGSHVFTRTEASRLMDHLKPTAEERSAIDQAFADV